MIDRSNHHLFQPLLYQVATADLSPADISAPIRSILKRQNNTSVILAEVTGIDVQRQQVLMHERSAPYDYLIVATGARHSYFGQDAWEPFAPDSNRSMASKAEHALTRLGAAVGLYRRDDEDRHTEDSAL